MSIRRSASEQLVLQGSPPAWLERCAEALTRENFTRIAVDSALGQVRGNFKPLVGSLYGDIVIMLTPEGCNTRVSLVATANVDNVYALVRSPGTRLIEKFKKGLAGSSPSKRGNEPQRDLRALVGLEIETLVSLLATGALTEAEFATAKRQLLDRAAGRFAETEGGAEQRPAR